MVPHLTRNHCETENDCQETPHLLVVQKVQVVSTQVEESSDEGRQHKDGYSSGIVWWSEDPNLNIGTLLNPFADHFGGNSHPLDIHGVSCFWFALRWEMNKDRSRVQTQQLKHVGALIEVNHSEEQLIRVSLRIAIRICHYRVLVVSVTANYTLPGRCHCSEHDDDRVVSRCRLYKVTETVPIEAHHRPLGVHVQQLLDFLRKGLRLKETDHCVPLLNSVPTHRILVDVELTP